MDIELKYSILRRFIWSGIVLGIIGLIILFSVLLVRTKEKNFEKYMQEIRNIEQRINEIVTNQENIIGVNISGLEAESEYTNAINGIKEKYGIDIKSKDYYFLNERNTENLNIGNINRVYVVNYEKEIVLCLQPTKYKKVKYYTTPEIEDRIFQNYSYSCPVIPEGFRHKYGGWDTGYVIVDIYGNEFVWVPVGKLNEEKASNAFTRYYKKITYQEYATDEYLAIEASIDKYGGYYIARYEASLQGATSYESTGKNNIIQSVPNVMPVTQITFKNEPEGSKIALSYGYDENGRLTTNDKNPDVRCALELCQKMADDYAWTQNGIHTTILYSEHYDTFFKVADYLGLVDKAASDTTEDPITINSKTIGNFLNSEFRYKRTKDSNFMLKLASEGVLLPTGSYLYKIDSDQSDGRNCIMNVYDLAGNLSEWTIEENNKIYNVVRGGNYANNGEDATVEMYTVEKKTFATSTIGIRPVMYID